MVVCWDPGGDVRAVTCYGGPDGSVERGEMVDGSDGASTDSGALLL